MLAEMKRDFITYARTLPKPYEEYNINELADGYCKAKDEDDEWNKNVYISALILRFWYTIEKMYIKNSGLNFERVEFLTWLVDAIEYACKYRAWQNPNKKVNAQQCINQCIETIRLQKYYGYHLDKNKANLMSVSLDTPLSSDADSATVVDTLAAPDKSDFERYGYSSAEILIQDYVNNNKIIEAIILDTIAFNDVQKHTKQVIKEVDENGEEYKYTKHTTEFWPYKLVQLVSKLPSDYAQYFAKKYAVGINALEASLNTLRASNNQKIYKYLDKTLADAKIVLSQ